MSGSHSILRHMSETKEFQPVHDKGRATKLDGEQGQAALNGGPDDRGRRADQDRIQDDPGQGRQRTPPATQETPEE